MSVSSTSILEAWKTSLNHLRAARLGYLSALEAHDAPADLAAQAAVNLGNSYDSIGRYTEAIEMYGRALGRSPGFAMALGNRGQTLLQAAPLSGHRTCLTAEAYWDLSAAIASRDQVIQYGTESALRKFERLVSLWKQPPKVRPEPEILVDAYGRWSQQNDLLLHPSPSCVRNKNTEWDPLFFKGVTIPLRRDDSELVPSVFAAFNVLKSEFASARWLAWIATTKTPITEHLVEASTHTRYLDTLDYARYDMFASIGRHAFQAGNNLLDKVATLITLYLGISRKKPYFRGWWKQRPSREDDTTIHPTVEAELAAKPLNLGFWALCDLTADFEEGGRYEELQQLRHSATHRLLTQHEYGSPDSTELLIRISWPRFKLLLVDQLRIARYALIYLVRAIDIREERSRASGGARRPKLSVERWLWHNPPP
jgi:tetratricopeptide (TPR) repeat protein